MANAEEAPPPAAPPVSADAVAPRRTRPPVTIEPAHLYRLVWLGFALMLTLRYFEVIARFLLVLYAAAILAVGLNAIGQRMPLQRRAVAVVIGLSVLGGVAALLFLGVPVMLRQARSMSEMGPSLTQQIVEWEQWIRQQTGMTVRLRPQSGAGNLLSGSTLLGNAATLLEIVLMPLVVFFGALFALATPNERLLTTVLRVVRPELRPAIYRILQLLGARLLGWLKGAVLAMLVVGTLSCVLYWLIGVPNALLIGLLNGVLEFIPLVGPWVGGGTAVLVTAADDSSKVAWVALAALAIQQVEGNLVTPLVMSREAKIHPFVTLFSLVLFGWLFGLLGMLLSIPLVLLIWTVVQVLWVERTIDTDQDAIAPVVKE